MTKTQEKAAAMQAAKQKILVAAAAGDTQSAIVTVREPRSAEVLGDPARGYYGHWCEPGGEGETSLYRGAAGKRQATARLLRVCGAPRPEEAELAADAADDDETLGTWMAWGPEAMDFSMIPGKIDAYVGRGGLRHAVALYGVVIVGNHLRRLHSEPEVIATLHRSMDHRCPAWLERLYNKNCLLELPGWTGWLSDWRTKFNPHWARCRLRDSGGLGDYSIVTARILGSTNPEV